MRNKDSVLGMKGSKALIVGPLGAVWPPVTSMHASFGRGRPADAQEGPRGSKNRDQKYGRSQFPGLRPDSPHEPPPRPLLRYPITNFVSPTTSAKTHHTPTLTHSPLSPKVFKAIEFFENRYTVCGIWKGTFTFASVLPVRT